MPTSLPPEPQEPPSSAGKSSLRVIAQSDGLGIYNAVVPCGQDGFIAVGMNALGGKDETEAVIDQYNADFQLVKTVRLGKGIAGNTIVSKDGGYLVRMFGNADSQILYLDKNFNRVWSIKPPPEGEKQPLFQYITQLKNGDIFATYSCGTEPSDLKLAFYDKNGKLKTQAKLFDCNYNSAVKIVEDGNGGVYLLGTHNADGLLLDKTIAGACNYGGCDVFVARLNARYEVVSAKAYGGSGNDALETAEMDKDGNLYLAMNTSSTDRDLEGCGANPDEPSLRVLLKISPDGKVLWKNVLCRQGFKMEQIGGIVLVGDRIVVNGSAPYQDGVLSRFPCPGRGDLSDVNFTAYITKDGNTENIRMFPIDMDNAGFSILPLPGDKFVVAGALFRNGYALGLPFNADERTKALHILE